MKKKKKKNKQLVYNTAIINQRKHVYVGQSTQKVVNSQNLVLKIEKPSSREVLFLKLQLSPTIASNVDSCFHRKLIHTSV